MISSILSLLSSHGADVQILTGDETKIRVASDLTIHQSERRVFSSNSEITLTNTRKEYDIFLYLIQSANQVLTFTQIYELVWKEPDCGTGQELVGHHTQNLRRKLNFSKNPRCSIRSAREVGYCLQMHSKP